MTSVERIQEYYQLKPEADYEKDEPKPPKNWPQDGVIEFKDVNFAHYEGGPDILHDICIKSKPSEKVSMYM